MLRAAKWKMSQDVRVRLAKLFMRVRTQVKKRELPNLRWGAKVLL